MNLKRLKHLFLGSIVAFSAVSSLAFTAPALAQANEVQTGLETVGEATGLGTEDPRLIVARIIRIVITSLGVIAVVIVLYGGFVWMTSAGDAEKVGRAKKILLSGGIGLMIILLSWSIVTFVMSALLNATGSGGGGGALGGGGAGGGGGIGGTSSTQLVVTGISPAGQLSIQNVVVRVTFNKVIDPASMNNQLKITNTSTGVEVPGLTAVAGNTITFRPDAPCAAPNDSRFCFDAATPFTITILPTLKSTTGLTLTCTANRPCSGAFTSGSSVDTEDPVARLTLPDNGQTVPSDSIQPVQVQATDDVGVASAGFLVGDVLFDEVTATGADLTDVIIDDVWDTAGLQNGQQYRVSATVSDLAGNTDTDAVTVRVKPAACFNGILDTGSGETGIDCGGDSLSPNYCGACAGGSCTTGDDCGSGLCVGGTCVDNPVINAVTPDSGAPGTYVTITGSGFGSTPGQVTFAGVGGPVVAAVAPCSGGWRDREITVVVPASANTGVITVLVNGSTRKDDTENDHGPVLPDFEVNTVIHPNLCSLDKSSAAPTDGLTLTGSNFGDARGTSVVIFGTQGSASSYSSWSNTSIATTVPQLPNGTFPVSVSVNGISSNAISLRVASSTSTTETLPSIVTISPNTGGVGRYVTLDGANFGTSKGTVRLTNDATGDTAVGSLDFPAACSTVVPWTSSQIRFIIPDKYTNGLAIAAGEYDVSVTTSGSQTSNTVPFTVITNDSAPNVCGVVPAKALVGDTVSLIGNQFGAATGTVTFYDAAQTNIASWSDTEVKVLVPAAAKTGPVSLLSGTGTPGNAVTFEVTSGGAAAAAAGASAGYAWSFSTGAIPHVPQIISECSTERVSSVPNNRFTDLVCTNAVIYAEFTEDMNEGTLNEAVRVERCTGAGTNPCSTVELVTGTLRSTPTSFTVVPAAPLLVSSTYRVTVTTAAQSLDGAALARDVSWTFVTKSDDSLCSVDSVRVSPFRAVITTLNGLQSFNALPTAGCVVVDSTGYQWTWTSSPSISRFNGTARPECSGGNSSCATVEALAEGQTPVAAGVDGTTVSGSSDLTINFLDPYLTGTWPACDAACPNAQVGGSFNIPMNANSVEQVGAVKLLACANELCTSVSEVSGVRATCVSVTGEPDVCTGFTMGNLTLTPGTFYKAVISGSVMSESGVRLTRTNDGGDYSWLFRAREDGAACAVDRIALAPADVTLRAVGEHASFTSTAFGAADSCSTSGQRLTGFSYDWSWVDPIADKNIDNDASTRVAEWLGDSLIDTSPTSVSAACTTFCTSKGSVAYSAICGDGRLDVNAGEECEDGNVAPGDGCSASCLREGNSTAGTTCGNAAVERVASGAGEDCDDGNRVDGDGCSAVCLAEGARFVGSTCGNNDVAANTVTKAGEDCDDGNARNGDGCSSQCLHEGTPTLAAIGGAVCGDSRLDTPAENCDDGNISIGDGCSDKCLLEGNPVAAFCTYAGVVPACTAGCGDSNVNPVREACDDGNHVSGDGCSNICLLEGSSTNYEQPSYCGDGVPGVGESAACEVGAAGDSRIDPLQTALIRDDAVFEVEDLTKKATATIAVTEVSSGLSTTSALSLSCSATTDRDCRDPLLFGVGAGNCCSLRPTVTLYPSAGTPVCRNQSVYGLFTEKMDLSSFKFTTETNAIVSEHYRMYLALSIAGPVMPGTPGPSGIPDMPGPGGVCPVGYTVSAHEPRGRLARARNAIVRFFTGASVAAADSTCILPIESFEQVPQGDGTFKVFMRYSRALEPNAEYTLVIKGDDNVNDAVTDGVRSSIGVGLNGTVTATFRTGPSLCSLDALQVRDTTTKTPYVFTRGDEVHLFNATAISHADNLTREIDSVPGTYAWDYTLWSPANVDLFSALRDPAVHEQANVGAKAKNGRTTLLAQATVTEDSFGADEGKPASGTVPAVPAKVVSGTAPLVAFLCENPWPELRKFPWEDTVTGGANGLASEGSGWMNFATYYCKDQGEAATADDLPSLSVIRPPVARTTGVIKEYLFEVADQSGDAIGVRVLSNSTYLSPLAWYKAQGFKGNPQSLTVDGFAALRDGRSVYVVAPNYDTESGKFYSNVYVLSYNDDASESTKKIFDAMLANLTLGLNIGDVGLCSLNGTAVTTMCSTTADCAAVGPTAICMSGKAQLRRDIRRLSDLTDIRGAIKDYRQENGVCSVTRSQFCSATSSCPANERCLSIVPELAAGTFVRNFSASAWDSWGDILGGALGVSTLPEDPLNTFNACGVTGGPYVSYEKNTCVDQSKGTFTCPAGSHIYQYQATGNLSAQVTADLEFQGRWASQLDTDGAADGVDLRIGNSASAGGGFVPGYLCYGSVIGASATCGDGVIGLGEVCEVGQQGGTAVDCDGNNDGLEDGYRAQICNATCTQFVDNPSSVCTSYSCGNAVIDPNEECDDGPQNGKYGFCGSSCTRSSGFSCGDGSLAGGEKCDCGSRAVFGTQGPPNMSRAFGAGPGSCQVYNGEYASSSGASCAWDCAGAAPFCGDRIVNTGSGEVCDGNTDSYAGKLCASGSVNMMRQPCTTNAECGGDEICGGVGKYAACPVAKVCTAGDAAKLGHICTTNGDCGMTGTCSADTYQTTRNRACGNGSNGPACQWVTPSYFDIDCTALSACGDGKKEGSEACDDGNTDSSDSCTNTCKLNVCGDGAYYVGVEECDLGPQNGQSCSSTYGSTCTACSITCRNVISSGAFCGDGVRNGTEFCDGSQVQYTYYDDVTGKTAGACQVIGAQTTVGSDRYTCKDLGVCNGGPRNGEYCTANSFDGRDVTSTDDADCLDSVSGTSYACIKPKCAGSCLSACPFSFTGDTALLLPNLPGSRAASSVDLYSYDSSSTSTLPNAATFTVPACTASGKLTGTISMDKVIPPEVNVVFVTDRSGSMDWNFNGDVVDSTHPGPKRIEEVRTVLDNAVEALFTALGEHVHISLVGYTIIAGTGMCTDTTVPINKEFNDSCDLSESCSRSDETGGVCQGKLQDVCSNGFCDQDQSSTLVNRIATYDAVGLTGTRMDLGLLSAKALLDELPNASNTRNIVIMLTDGDPNGADPTPTTNAANAVKAEYELYTVTLSEVDSLVDQMKAWSSNTPGQEINTENGVDYAYNGDTPDALAASYDSVISSITGVTVSLLSTNPSNQSVVGTSAVLHEGANQTLPWPTYFKCDGVNAKQVPLQITFGGAGQITISDVHLDYCAP